MLLKYLLLSVLLAIECVSVASGKRHVVCYLASWANYRNGEGKYVVEDIDPLQCTHAIYAFAKLHDNEITVYDTYLDLEENWGLGGYKRFNDMRQKNPELKTLVAIGGWNEGSVNYSQMVTSQRTREIFVQSVVAFLGKYSFNGLDIDWEYPANRGGKPEDKQNFVLLLKELHAALEPRGYLLTAAVSAGISTIDSAYDIPQVSRYLDLINIMTYDFHGAWGPVTGINSPLYANDSASEEYKQLTVDNAIRYWIDGGADVQKVVMGIGFYGRSFTLEDPSKHGVGDKSIGNGVAGIYTNQSGSLGFNEICLHLTRDGWTEEWDDAAKAPYAYKDDQWVSYENDRSIQAKVEYIKEKDLSGALIWSVDTDDFRGTCYGHAYYLQNVLTHNLWK